MDSRMDTIGHQTRYSDRPWIWYLRSEVYRYHMQKHSVPLVLQYRPMAGAVLVPILHLYRPV